MALTMLLKTASTGFMYSIILDDMIILFTIMTLGLHHKYVKY